MHGLVEEDDAREELPDAGRREEHRSVVAAGFLGGLHPYRLETLAYGAVALVRGEYALALRYEFQRRVLQRLKFQSLLLTSTGKEAPDRSSGTPYRLLCDSAA
jgi:hypothetical protein